MFFTNKTRNTVIKNSVCFLHVLWISVLQSPIHAQETDFTTWTNVGFEYKMMPAFTLNGGLDWRTKNNLEMTDRWGVKIGGTYKAVSFLKIETGYEMHYRNQGDDGWKLRHRYHLGNTLSTRMKRLKLSLRERFQYTFDGSSDKFSLRSRVKLAYDIPKWELEPYTSVEMNNSLNSGKHFDVRFMRYRGGITLPVLSCWKMDLFYCHQSEQDKRKNIVGFECTYCF